MVAAWVKVVCQVKIGPKREMKGKRGKREEEGGKARKGDPSGSTQRQRLTDEGGRRQEGEHESKILC
jgi:hypothetical protein